MIYLFCARFSKEMNYLQIHNCSKLKLKNHHQVNWNKLTEENQLAQIKEESFTQPVMIFKHSTTCSISATSLGRMERKWNDAAAGNLKPYYLDLLKFRPISTKIAQEFKVEHQSPQVLIIKNGEAIYDASHFDISFDAVKEV